MTGSGAVDPASRTSLLRAALLVVVLAGTAVALQVTGWSGPERLREAVDSAGAAGAVVFVVGYALLVLVPTPASLLTILGGALFGVVLGSVLVWAGATLGALGGFVLGRRLGRPAVDRLLRGRLHRVDAALGRHGLPAVLAVRLVPVLPFTPLNYASGAVALRSRDYALGTAVGIVPGTVAYVSVGASGAEPFGIVLGVGVLLLLTVGGGWAARRLLRLGRGDQVA